MTNNEFCVILIIVSRPFPIIRDKVMIVNDNKKLNQNRSGRYITQIAGYKAFIPKLLPPDPPNALTNTPLVRVDR